MINTFKILSLFLSYPSPDLKDFLHEGTEELRKDGLLEGRILENLEGFAGHFAGMDLIEWQAHYVSLFDTSRSASLYLFEHLKGDSRERGQAMADLLEFYRENGLELSAGELPDYLPVFLEFLSAIDLQKACELLFQPVNIINRIYSVLNESNNMYRHVFEAIISLSSEKPDNEDFRDSSGSPMNAGFDELYDEPPAGPGETFIPDK